MSEDVNAIASAVEEVAKVTGKSVDAISKLGGFISEYTRAPLEAAVGIFADKLNYMRWERQQRLLIRAREFSARAGLSGPTRPVPLSFAVPLLESASLEEDDSLQDLWAILLVNAADVTTAIDHRRAYISILEQLNPLDALILSKVYGLPYGLNDEGDDRAAVTSELPDTARLMQEGDELNTIVHPSEEVTLSLANLVRIGCLDAEEGWSGKKDYRYVYRNVLGRAFVEAVTLNEC